MAAPLPPGLNYRDHPIAQRLRIAGRLRIAFVALTVVAAFLIAYLSEITHNVS